MADEHKSDLADGLEPALPSTPPPEPKNVKAAILANPWPFVALLLGGGALFALIAIFAPEEVRTALFGAHGLLFTLIGLWMRSPKD